MTLDRLGRDLASGRPLLSAWSSIPDPTIVETLARLRFDAVTLDMQHGLHGDADIARLIPAILLAGKSAIVRVPVGRFDMTSRALDFGAHAIVAPMIDSVEDAVAFRDAAKYPPLGKRSWGPVRVMAAHGLDDPQAYLRSANRHQLAIAMIETRAAYAALDGILDVDGIDGVFVGPSDLSVAWTDGAEWNPAAPSAWDAIVDVAWRAKARGKHAWTFAVEGAFASKVIDEAGYGLVAYGIDLACLELGVRTLMKSGPEVWQRLPEPLSEEVTEAIAG